MMLLLVMRLLVQVRYLVLVKVRCLALVEVQARLNYQEFLVDDSVTRFLSTSTASWFEIERCQMHD